MPTPPPPRHARFKRGQSGNPGGRPKGVMEYARNQTKDGKLLVDLLVAIVKGEKSIRGVRPTFDHRIQAVRELFNRGWARVPDSEGRGPWGHGHLGLRSKTQTRSYVSGKRDARVNRQLA